MALDRRAQVLVLLTGIQCTHGIVSWLWRIQSKRRFERQFPLIYFSIRLSRSSALRYRSSSWMPAARSLVHLKPRWPPIQVNARSWRSYNNELRFHLRGERYIDMDIKIWEKCKQSRIKILDPWSIIHDLLFQGTPERPETMRLPLILMKLKFYFTNFHIIHLIYPKNCTQAWFLISPGYKSLSKRNRRLCLSKILGGK